MNKNAIAEIRKAVRSARRHVDKSNKNVGKWQEYDAQAAEIIDLDDIPDVDDFEVSIAMKIVAELDKFDMEYWCVAAPASDDAMADEVFVDEAADRLRDDDGGLCGTTMCRAGFAVATAGSAAAELLETYGWSGAAGALYRKNAGHVPDFYGRTRDALRDILARAIVILADREGW